MPILTYVDDFLHHPTFPREATRGDFFSLMPQSRAFTGARDHKTPRVVLIGRV
jgi:hypothetical protein